VEQEEEIRKFVKEIAASLVNDRSQDDQESIAYGKTKASPAKRVVATRRERESSEEEQLMELE
jgi:hypothetical protein